MKADFKNLFQEDSMSVEIPLGYPSSAPVDQTGHILVNEFTTGIPVLRGEIGASEDSNNVVSSESAFPTKPSREQFHDKSPPDTEDIATDHQSFTVPFNVLGSSNSPSKPEDSHSPPSVDDSASNDLITNGYESPTEPTTTLAVYTTGSFTPPNILQAGHENNEAEEKKDLTDITEPPFKEADQDSLPGQGKPQKIFP